MKPQQRAETIAHAIDVAALVAASLAPLNLLLLVRLVGASLPVIIALIAASVIGIAGVMRFFWRSTDDNEFSPRVDRVEDVGSEAGGYLVSFVFPLLVVQDASASDLIAYCLFVVVYIVVLMSSDLLAINPLLYLFGWRIWRVDSTGFETGTALIVGRSRPHVGESYSVVGLGRVYVQKREGRNDVSGEATQ